jgi:hypothetical protein
MRATGLVQSEMFCVPLQLLYLQQLQLDLHATCVPVLPIHVLPIWTRNSRLYVAMGAYNKVACVILMHESLKIDRGSGRVCDDYKYHGQYKK